MSVNLQATIDRQRDEIRELQAEVADYHELERIICDLKAERDSETRWAHEYHANCVVLESKNDRLQARISELEKYNLDLAEESRRATEYGAKMAAGLLMLDANEAHECAYDDDLLDRANDAADMFACEFKHVYKDWLSEAAK